MARTQSQKIIRYGVFTVLGLVVAAILAYALIIRPLQIRQQKANFDKAEASLDALALQIENTVGKPDETKKEKSCDRANLKSERGPLLCNVTVSVLFNNQDHVRSTDLMKRVETFGTGGLRMGSGSVSGIAFKPLNESRGAQIFYQDLSISSKPSCVLGYNFPASAKKVFQNAHESSFQIDISCGGPAMKEFFPLRD